MHNSIIFALLALILLIGFPANAEAQYRGSYWNSREGGDFDREEVRRWREENSRVRESINDLDDDPVEDLPIPILFGVSLSSLFPNFGDPRDGGSRTHEGFDLMAEEGTPIVSPTEAVVIRVGDGSGSGLYVSTANPGDETFVYMHLSEVADIDEGDVLEAGDLIGYVGNTGNASGGATHLHFEIRENREPSDPYPRLTKEFTLREKMEFLENILDEHDDAEELAEFLVGEYQNIFTAARVEGQDLPEAIEEAMPIGALAVPAGAPTSDLKLGDQGPAVVALQSKLIASGHLDIATPTDYFGPLTQAALIKYQQANGITPANGVYGPLTRASMSGSASANTMTREQLIKEIERLLKLIAERNR